jgi:hypothetical protein
MKGITMDNNIEKLFASAKKIDLGEHGTLRMRYLPLSKIPDFANLIFKAMGGFTKTGNDDVKAFDLLSATITSCGDELYELIQTCVDKDLNEFPGTIVGPTIIGEFLNMNMEGDTLKKWSTLLENTLGVRLYSGDENEAVQQ